jgi:hypothetical protein
MRSGKTKELDEKTLSKNKVWGWLALIASHIFLRSRAGTADTLPGFTIRLITKATLLGSLRSYLEYSETLSFFTSSLSVSRLCAATTLPVIRDTAMQVHAKLLVLSHDIIRLPPLNKKPMRDETQGNLAKTSRACWDYKTSA